MMLPTWDLIVTFVFIILIIYGLALGRERVLVLLASSYIGLVVATIWGNSMFDVLSGSSATSSGITITTNASLFAVKSIIFVVLTLLLVVKGDFFKKASTAHDGIFSLVISSLYAIGSAGLILTSLASFLPDTQRTDILTDSTLAASLINFQVWWIVLPVILIIASGFKNSNNQP